MAQIVRESAFGQLLRLATGNKYFRYQEEDSNFQVPWDLNAIDRKTVSDASSSRHESITPPNEKETTEEPVEEAEKQSRDLERHPTEKDTELDRTTSQVIQPKKTQDGYILVDWYTTDDPENPQNWSTRKKNYVSIQLILYTFVVYCASAIYTPSIYGVMQRFGVDQVEASLGLVMYVLGYGFGPLLFSPMSEIPLFGRNIPYISSFGLFVILAVPTALVDNYAGLLVLRFLTGFLGSPCLATGGATMQDIYSFMNLPYAFTAWVAAAFGGPALGPLLSGFAVMAKGWRWSLWEILWMSGPVFLVMFFSFPETSSSNILLRRAKRIRKLTGNPKFKSQSEIDQGNMKFSKIFADSLIKPFQITLLDPAVLFTNVYTSLIYGIYYSFFEAFPIVYLETYGFNIGQMGIVFLCINVGAFIGIVIYCSYIKWYLNPDIAKNGLRQQEHRLVPALFASLGLPIGLFIFGWTARESIHWIVPVIGITIFAASGFVLMQCVFMYLPLSYPQYAASLFAANDTLRSCLAGGSIVFAHPLFVNLGIGRGVSLLGGLAAGGVIGIWLLWIYGARLRARSSFAQS